MGKQYRYPGAQPFSNDQQDIFFGREEDTEALYELIQLEQWIVLYSKSGMGKSSLLQAGLLPKIRQFVPITIRFGAHQEGQPGPITRSRQAIDGDAPVHPLLKGHFPEGDSLWYSIKNQQLLSGRDSYLLLFDQFEELFTYPDDDILEFKKQLAELANVEIPNRFRKLIQQQFEGGEELFSDEELELLHRPVTITAIMAIRSDRMSLLNKLTSHIPNLLKCCYELKPLNLNQAEEAILSPAYRKGEEFFSPPFDYKDETLDHILDFLTRGKSQEIESFQLQILCQYIEQKVIREGLSVVRLEDLGNIEGIYENYYDNQIARLDSEEERLATRRLIEEGLIFEQEKRRLSMYEGQIYQTFDISPELLRKLVDVHLLRAEPSLKGGYVYELTHDTIVGPILRAKHRRLAEERRIADEEARRERERELQELREEAEEAQRKRRRARAIAIGTSLLAVIAVAASIFAFALFQRAEAAEAAAIEEKLRVETLNSALEESLSLRLQADYQSLLEQGRRLESEGRFTTAIARLDSAIGLAEEHPAYFENGPEEARAAKEATLALQKQASDFERLILEGERMEGRGTEYLPAALAKYKAARRLNINDNLNGQAQVKADALSLDMKNKFEQLKTRGELYLQAGNISGGCSTLRLAQRLQPDNARVKELLKQCN